MFCIYEEKIGYTENKNNRKRRKRRIIWYNPPYSKSIKTSIGKKFNSLIRKHFTKENPLSKIFNKNSIKLSYSCTRNIGQIIKAHNRKILQKGKQEEQKTCNCRKIENCPMKKESDMCRQKNVIYQAVVKTEGEEERNYIGLTANELKERYRAHRQSFKDAKHENKTKLSKYVWKLKRENKQFEIDWKIIGKTKEASNGQTTCTLCLKEIAEILKGDKNCLNQNNEFLGTCRHTSKFLLKNWKRRAKTADVTQP